MSLKKIVLVLVFANLGYFAYSQGWLNLLLGSDAAEREPERITRQINASAIEISVAPVATASAPLTPEPANATAQTPACTDKRELWLIYMGPFASKALQEKKKRELAALGLGATEVSKTSLKLGLSLGQYESESFARDALKKLTVKGVKTATIVLWATNECP